MAKPTSTNSSYQTGDLLRRHLSWYADHYGVYLGRHHGQEWVIEITRVADQPERVVAHHPDSRLWQWAERMELEGVWIDGVSMMK